MNLLEAMKSGKKFTRTDWAKHYWQQWTGNGFIDSHGKPEEILNNSYTGYEFFIEPLVWAPLIPQEVQSHSVGRAKIFVPKAFVGKKVRICIEEIPE